MKKDIKVLLGIGVALLAIIAFNTLENKNITDPLGGGFSDPYSHYSASTSTSKTITGDASILATSSERVYARFCNDSANVVYLNMDNDKAASGSVGTRLNASGGCYEITSDNLYLGSVRAFASTSATSTILVTEYTK